MQLEPCTSAGAGATSMTAYGTCIAVKKSMLLCGGQGTGRLGSSLTVLQGLCTAGACCAYACEAQVTPRYWQCTGVRQTCRCHASLHRFLDVELIDVEGRRQHFGTAHRHDGLKRRLHTSML